LSLTGASARPPCSASRADSTGSGRAGRRSGVQQPDDSSRPGVRVVSWITPSLPRLTGQGFMCDQADTGAVAAAGRHPARLEPGGRGASPTARAGVHANPHRGRDHTPCARRVASDSLTVPRLERDVFGARSDVGTTSPAPPLGRRGQGSLGSTRRVVMPATSLPSSATSRCAPTSASAGPAVPLRDAVPINLALRPVTTR
jgi:hypothetical protein